MSGVVSSFTTMRTDTSSRAASVPSARRRNILALFFLGLTVLPVVPEQGPAIHADALLWRYVAGGSIRGRPVLQEGRVYALAEDWYLHALDADSGARLWRYDLGGRVSGLLGAGPDGTVAAATERGVLHAVNPSGKMIWTYDAGSQPVTAPAFDAGGTVYFGTADDVLSSVSHIGRLRWRYLAPGGITAGPVIGSDGVIYIGSGRGTVYALTPWGDTIWSASVEGTPDFILPGPETTVIGTKEGAAFAFSGKGTPAWDRKLPGPGGVFSGNEDVFACVYPDGSGVRVSGDGEVIESFRAPAFPLRVVSAVLDPGGTLYAASPGGAVYRKPPGGEYTRIAFEDASAAAGGSIALSDHGILFSGRDDWVLAAYRVASSRPRTEYGSFRSEYTTSPPALKNVSDYGYLLEFAKSDRPDLKEIALSDIEKRFGRYAMMDSGGYLKSVLRYFVEEAVFHAVFRNRVVENNYPELRIRAVNLLAEISDIDDIPWFTMMLRYEYDKYVRSALVRALGTVGSESGGRSIEALSLVLTDSKAGPADSTLALEVLGSLEKMYLYHGSVPDIRFYEVLNRILGGNFSRQVREKALILLKRTRDN